MSNNFIAIRTKYYKKEKAKSLDKHVRRKNNISTNAYPHLSENNFSKQFRTKTSCNDEYFKINKRKTRSDFNEVFEHLGILSLEKFEDWESKDHKKLLHSTITKIIERYANEVKDKYGFEPLRFDFHLDEGHTDENGVFKRNIHFHLQFFNYDFKNKVAPLKNIQKKKLMNIDLETGEEIVKYDKEDLENKIAAGKVKQVLITNPFFSDIQDLAAKHFKQLGFKRGISKNITGKEHFEKDKFIEEKHKEQLEQINQVNAEIADKQALNADLDALNADLDAKHAEKIEELADISIKHQNAKKTIKIADEITLKSEEEDEILDFIDKHFNELADMYVDYDNKPIDFKRELDGIFNNKVNEIVEQYEDLSIKGKSLFEKIFNNLVKFIENIENKFGKNIAENNKVSVKLKNKIKNN